MNKSFANKILLNDAPNAVLGAFAKLRKVTFNFVISVRLSVCLPLSLHREEIAAHTGRIFLKFDI
jgi:hypothetical protein